MFNGIKYNELDALIDKRLESMFGLNTRVGNMERKEIKDQCMKLSGFFTEMISEYNNMSDTLEYFENILNRIDMFVMAYRSTLNSLPDKYIAVCVGSIWYDFILGLEEELKDKILYKVLWEYGVEQIKGILLEKIRKA